MPVGLWHWIGTPEGPGHGVACESQAEAEGGQRRRMERPGVLGRGGGGCTHGPFSVPAPAASAGHADGHGPRDLRNRPVAPVGQLLQPQ